MFLKNLFKKKQKVSNYQGKEENLNKANEKIEIGKKDDTEKTVDEEKIIGTINLDYIVGQSYVKEGLYKSNVGTERIGYFDPRKVVLKRVKEGWMCTFPPDGLNREEGMEFAFKIGLLQTALGITGNAFGFGATPQELQKFLINISEVGKANEGAIAKLIYEETVYPFFELYSADEKVVIIEDVEKEVLMNSIINFFCTEIDVKKAKNLNDLKKCSLEKVNNLKASKT
ncbi:MAG: hypothetical protein EPN82_02405 [Bacteroidetes bacterium]|nr:MAG: hypothetical protein EPN82_02405 [Bacteroidota bacterium]